MQSLWFVGLYICVIRNVNVLTSAYGSVLGVLIIRAAFFQGAAMTETLAFLGLCRI